MTNQGSRYTPYGLSFYSGNVKDAMWREAPHPAIMSPLVGFGKVEDFLGFSEDEWTTTAVSAGTGTSTIALTGIQGGVLRINTAANEDDGAQAQSDAAIIKLAATNLLWMDFRINLTEEATQSDAFVGLADTDTTIIAGAPNDIVYWHKDDGDTNWDFTADINGAGPTNLLIEHTAVAATQVILGFTYDGTTLTPWVDGVKSANTIATNVPNDIALKISFGYLNGAAAAQNEGMNIDWIRYAVIEDRT